jgi:hypothetical protein
MRRMSALGLAITAATMLACVGASSASATVRCAVVWTAGTGIYKDAACSVTGGTKEYIKVLTGGTKLKGREEGGFNWWTQRFAFEGIVGVR